MSELNKSLTIEFEHEEFSSCLKESKRCEEIDVCVQAIWPHRSRSSVKVRKGSLHVYMSTGASTEMHSFVNMQVSFIKKHKPLGAKDIYATYCHTCNNGSAFFSCEHTNIKMDRVWTVWTYSDD